MLMLDEPDRFANNTQGDKVVLSLSLDEDTDNLPRGLIEGLRGGQNVAARQCLRFAEDAFRAVLVDVKSEDLAVKFGVDDDIACSGGRVWQKRIGLAGAPSR